LQVFFIDYDGLDNTVFESQVLCLCESLQKKGITLYYVGYNLFHKKNLKKPGKKVIQNRLNGSGVFLPKFFYIGSINLWVSALLFLFKTRFLYRAQKTVVLHCRSTLSGRIGLYIRKIFFWKKIRVITDYRGVHAEHFDVYPNELFPKWSPIVQKWKKSSFDQIRFLCASESDYHITVTHALEKFYELEPCLVTPCCYDPHYFNLESEGSLASLQEKIGEREVFVYSGGLQEYQCITEMLSIFKYWSSKYNCFLIFLTKKIEQAKKEIEILNLDTSCVYVTSALPQELKGYFQLASAAFVLREDNIVNQVASPVKVGEYLGCGLPLIYTKHIGVIQDLLQSKNIGVPVDLTQINHKEYLEQLYVEVAHAVKKISTREIAEFAQNRLLMPGNVDRIIEVYNTLNFHL
jgi:hypothetical protein